MVAREENKKNSLPEIPWKQAASPGGLCWGGVLQGRYLLNGLLEATQPEVWPIQDLISK